MTKKTTEAETEKPPRATKDTPDEELTEEQLYQRKYYQERKAERLAAHRKRWEEDEEYRQREIERARKRREERREETASERFDAMVEEKRQKALETNKRVGKGMRGATQKPRRVGIEGRRTFVYSTGSLAREVGREPSTIRAWLETGVLPGASVWLGGRAHFTERFCRAVYHACRRLFEVNGRGELEVLAELIREEFAKGDVSWVREPRGARQRVKATP